MTDEPAQADPLRLTDAEWRSRLTPEQYRVLREKGTERPFSGALCDEHREGTYRCAGCGTELFDSRTKFDSGTGWPSFDRPAGDKALETGWDYSEAEARVEVTCRRCGAHLGHVFQDGPTSTGLRYCINSLALKLDSEKPTPAPARKSARAQTSRSTRKSVKGPAPAKPSAVKPAAEGSSKAES
jgi:peptide-methionine (R)-S-oxide reductase